MDRITVKDNKVTVVSGVVITIVFGIFICFSAADRIGKEEWFMLCFSMIVFGSGMCFGIYLILGYIRRRLILNGDVVTYIPVLGRKRNFSFSEGRKLKVIVCNGILQYQILDCNEKKLAVFGNYMINCDEVVHAFVQRGMKVDTLQKRIHEEADSGIDKKVTKGKRSEAAFIKKRWKTAQIEKERRLVQMMKKLLIFLAAIAVLLPGNLRLTVYILILWTIWALYLILYPRMTVEPSAVKEVSRYYITAPRAAAAVSVLILFFLTKTVNAPDNKVYFRFLLIYAGVLLVPYVLTLYIKKIQERPEKIFLVIFGAFIIAISSMHALNYTATFREEKHRQVTVTDKTTEHTPGHSFFYYIHINLDGEEEILSVPSDLYREAEKGDRLRLCERVSVFGYKYWILHK